MKRRNFIKTLLAAIPAFGLAKVVEGEEQKDPREEYPLYRISPDGSVGVARDDWSKKVVFSNKGPFFCEKLYLSLHENDPMDSSLLLIQPVKEVSGRFYSRIVVKKDQLMVTEKAILVNIEPLYFQTAGDYWGPVGSIGMWDHPNSKNELHFMGSINLPFKRNVYEGDTVGFQYEDLAIAL